MAVIACVCLLAWYGACLVQFLQRFPVQLFWAVSSPRLRTRSGLGGRVVSVGAPPPRGPPPGQLGSRITRRRTRAPRDPLRPRSCCPTWCTPTATACTTRRRMGRRPRSWTGQSRRRCARARLFKPTQTGPNGIRRARARASGRPPRGGCRGSTAPQRGAPRAFGPGKLRGRRARGRPGAGGWGGGAGVRQGVGA
mgnify:CR=1 FL=1